MTSILLKGFACGLVIFWGVYLLSFVAHSFMGIIVILGIALIIGALVECIDPADQFKLFDKDHSDDYE